MATSDTINNNCVTNTEILCFILGWQGGTIHQVGAALNCSCDRILHAQADDFRMLCRDAQNVRNRQERWSVDER
jgi:hypothetical protein